MTIELSTQLETALVAEATRRGMTPDDLAAELIISQLPAADMTPAAAEPPNGESDKSPPQTLYDRWKDHLESIREASAEARGPTDLSQDSGRKFAELLRQRREQGRL